MDEKSRQNLQTIRGIGPKRSQHIATVLENLQQNLTYFFSLDVGELRSRFGLPVNVAEAVVHHGYNFAGKVDIKPIKQVEPRSEFTLGSSDYPEHLATILGKDAPPVVQLWGNLELLQKPSVGFCGSRNATEKGISVAIDVAEQISTMGWVVVSGHAKGVDTAAHIAALKSGGATIVVAAEGLDEFRLKNEIKKFATPENILIISQFQPKSRWSVGNAMTRNKTIIGLSDAMILVEARKEGGTFEAGKATLKLGLPLFVAQYSEIGDWAAGNSYFLSKGARPLKRDKLDGRASIQNLRETVLTKHQQKSGDILSTVPTEQLLLL